MFRNGRRLPPPPLARGVGVGLYLGAMLETGVNVTARALPPTCFFFLCCVLIVRLLSSVFFLFRVHCASVADCVAPRVLGFS